MAVQQADIDALTLAIANPERQVAHNGVQITYRSIEELIRARDALIAQKAAEDSASRAGRITYVYQAGRGFSAGCEQ